MSTSKSVAGLLSLIILSGICSDCNWYATSTVLALISVAMGFVTARPFLPASLCQLPVCQQRLSALMALSLPIFLLTPIAIVGQSSIYHGFLYFITYGSFGIFIGGVILQLINYVSKKEILDAGR